MFCKVQKAVGCQSTPTCTQEGRKFKRQMKGSCSLDCPSQWQFCCAGLNHFSRVWLSVTLWTVVCQALLSMGFSRQEYWSRLPCLSARNLPNPGVKPASLMSSALAGGFFTNSTTWEVPSWMFTYVLSFFFFNQRSCSQSHWMPYFLPLASSCSCNVTFDLDPNTYSSLVPFSSGIVMT